MGADLQEEIIQRMGVSDFDLSHRHSRPSQLRLVRALLNAHLIVEDFSSLDGTALRFYFVSPGLQATGASPN